MLTASPSCREQYGAHHCDRRVSKTELQATFPAVNFDAIVAEDDPDWTEKRESKQHLAERCVALLRELSARDEKTIGVVCHSSFLKCMFALLLDTSQANGAEKWFSTGELRALYVDFAPYT